MFSSSSSDPVSLCPLNSLFSPGWSPGTEGSRVDDTWDQESIPFLLLSPTVSPMPLQASMSRVYEFDPVFKTFLDGPDGTIQPYDPPDPHSSSLLDEFGLMVNVSVVSSATSGTIDVTGSIGAPSEAQAASSAALGASPLKMSESPSATVQVGGSDPSLIVGPARIAESDVQGQKAEAAQPKRKRKSSKHGEGRSSSKRSRSTKSSKEVFGVTPGEASSPAAVQQDEPVHEPDNPEMCMVGAAQLKYLTADFTTYRDEHPMGAGFKLKLPGDQWHVVTRRTDVRGYFGCYRAAIDQGLRFPIHPCIWDILEKYDLTFGS